MLDMLQEIRLKQKGNEMKKNVIAVAVVVLLALGGLVGAKPWTVGAIGGVDEFDAQFGLVTGEKSWIGVEATIRDKDELDGYGLAVVGLWTLANADIPMTLPWNIGTIQVKADIYTGFKIGGISTEMPGTNDRDEDVAVAGIAGAAWGDGVIRLCTEYRYNAIGDGFESYTNDSMFVVGIRYTFK